MFTQIQSLDAAKIVVEKAFRQNPNSRVSAMFRHIRNQQRFSLIGDYPILATIISCVLRIGVKPSRLSINHALNQSEELKAISKKDKNVLLDGLLVCHWSNEMIKKSL